MNLFTFRKMEEDHFTNILMNILSFDSYTLLPSFLNNLLPEQARDFSYEKLGINLFSKSPDQLGKPIEYIIGIAPYKSTDNPNELENNMDSIPDAWIYGSNFNLLFEFKIRGTLDDAQLAAHKTKLQNYSGTIKLQWSDVISALGKCKDEGDEIQQFLIGEFIKSSKQFKSKRRASGMPKEIIGALDNTGNLFFRITGSKETGVYTVDIVYPDQSEKRLESSLGGIQESRRWIARYVMDNQNILPLNDVSPHTIITDFCVKPGRLKNSWNQWRLGSYLI